MLEHLSKIIHILIEFIFTLVKVFRQGHCWHGRQDHLSPLDSACPLSLLCGDHRLRRKRETGAVDCYQNVNGTHWSVSLKLEMTLIVQVTTKEQWKCLEDGELSFISARMASLQFRIGQFCTTSNLHANIELLAELQNCHPGSVECSKNVEDCSEGGETGRGYGGSMTFKANGMVSTDTSSYPKVQTIFWRNRWRPWERVGTAGSCAGGSFKIIKIYSRLLLNISCDDLCSCGSWFLFITFSTSIYHNPYIGLKCCGKCWL